MSTTLVRESEIEAYLVKRVRELGGISYKFVSPGVTGVPDRIVILGGKVLFMELKAPGKKPTAAQMRILERIADHGALAGWADTKKEVDATLKAAFDL